MKPAYKETARNGIFPLQVGSFSYRYFKFGSSELQILGSVKDYR
jgi:hypothetical protein